MGLHPRREEAGLDDDDTDPEMGQLDIEGLGDGLQGVLGGGVVAAQGPGDVPGHRGDVDDDTGAAAEHAGHESLDQANRAEDVHLEHLADLFHRDLLDRAGEGDGGIVDEGVHPSELSLEDAQLGEVARKMQGGARPWPELVANAVAAAIDNDTGPLRRRVGDDANLILSARSTLGDEEFEKAMRAVLGLSW